MLSLISCLTASLSESFPTTSTTIFSMYFAICRVPPATLCNGGKTADDFSSASRTAIAATPDRSTSFPFLSFCGLIAKYWSFLDERNYLGELKNTDKFTSRESHRVAESGIAERSC
ncbi:hypothetical protein B0H14DRAFT_2735470, partial [Mycena olivaceomarginata]